VQQVLLAYQEQLGRLESQEQQDLLVILATQVILAILVIQEAQVQLVFQEQLVQLESQEQQDPQEFQVLLVYKEQQDQPVIQVILVVQVLQVFLEQQGQQE